MNVQYDELMKQIIQAEYDFNNALANAFKPFVYMVDNREKCTEQKHDESYLQGAEDMKKALCILHDSGKIFNTAYERILLECVSAANIIKKAEELKEEQEKLKEATFDVGDEIECVAPFNMQYGKKYIVLRVREEMKLFDLSDHTIYYTNNFVDYRKTGKHYDSIPIPKEGEEDE